MFVHIGYRLNITIEGENIMRFKYLYIIESITYMLCFCILYYGYVIENTFTYGMGALIVAGAVEFLMSYIGKKNNFKYKGFTNLFWKLSIAIGGISIILGYVLSLDILEESKFLQFMIDEPYSSIGIAGAISSLYNFFTVKE